MQSIVDSQYENKTIIEMVDFFSNYNAPLGGCPTCPPSINFVSKDSKFIISFSSASLSFSSLIFLYKTIVYKVI